MPGKPRSRGGGGGGGGVRSRGGGRPPSRSGQSKAGLVEQIKAKQRADQGFRRAWGQYCEANGSGVRDPDKHAPSWLAKALQVASKGGGRAPSRGPQSRGPRSRGPQGGYGGYGGQAAMGGGAPRPTSGRQAVEAVKANQRADPGWQQAWTNYCLAKGGGVSDPGKHGDGYLRTALATLGPPNPQQRAAAPMMQQNQQQMAQMALLQQYMAQMGLVNPQMGMGMMPMMAPKPHRPPSRPQQPRLPRSRGGGGGGAGGRSRGGGGGGTGRPRSRGGYAA